MISNMVKFKFLESIEVVNDHKLSTSSLQVSIEVKMTPSNVFPCRGETVIWEAGEWRYYFNFGNYSASQARARARRSQRNMMSGFYLRDGKVSAPFVRP